MFINNSLNIIMTTNESLPFASYEIKREAHGTFPKGDP